MQAVILAGGQGTRLRPLTTTIPKPLLPVANQALVERQLRWLADAGVTTAVLALGYRSGAFAARFPEGRFGSLRLRFVVEPRALGTAGAVRHAAEAAGIAEPFLVCNGDVLTDYDLAALIRTHTQQRAAATIALTRVADPSAFGVVPTDESGRVVDFVEKPAIGTAPTSWINAGAYVLDPSVLGLIPSGREVSIEREVFPGLLRMGKRVFARRDRGAWIDIGTPAQFLRANELALGGAFGPAPGAGEGGVWIQGAAMVDPRSGVEAPVLLGNGVVVGAGALVSGSVLGRGCRVEPGARVIGSVLLDDARVRSGAVVVDSILGPDSVVEPGARIGGHTVLGAGARVEAGELIVGGHIELPGPGILLEQARSRQRVRLA
ncbi:MAG: sugar phosphate nucleotidyltransferase [Acidimicrobiia bacterium]